MQNWIRLTKNCKVMIDQGKEFLQKFPSIQKIFNAKIKSKAHKIIQNHPARHYVQGIYIGPVDKNSFPHSQSSDEGIFLYEAGFLYMGLMKNSKRTGEGILINQDGQYYIGQWNHNNPNGKGEYVSTQSSRSYKGQWQEGLQHGNGVQQYDDKSIYEGEFISGSKHGHGRLTYPDGTFYQGQFLSNSITGNGTCVGKFHKYEGEWQNGKMHGNGISTWNDQTGQVIGQYVGQYKEGLKHGYGEYRWVGKKVYKGRWEDGEMKSQGVVLNYEG